MRLATGQFRAAGFMVLSALLQVVIFPVAGPLPRGRAALAWVALAPMLWALLDGLQTEAGRAEVLRRIALGYACGVLWYAGTCYWVYDTMHIYGGLSAFAAGGVLILFCLYLAIYHAVFAAALVWVGRSSRLGVRIALLMAPFLWVAVELARARVTSFPWNLLGYAQVDDHVLTLLVPVTGVYGLSFLLAAVSSVLAAFWLLGRRWQPAAGVAVGVAMAVQVAGWIWVPTLPAGTATAVMLQPNLLAGAPVPQGLSLAAEFAQQSQAVAAKQHGTAVILWPESPSPFATDRAEFSGAVSLLSQQEHAPVIAGAIGVLPDAGVRRGVRIYNSATLFTPERGLVGRYDKIHLVPFGEFVPYASLFSFASGLTEAVGQFDRGVSRQPLNAEGHRYGVFLCYESIFGDEVRQFVRNGAEVLVNLSDDGWYGDTSAPFQHLNMARMRAMENRRWLLRDTNNGVTAAIDPMGMVRETMPRHVEGVVAMRFDYAHSRTLYTRFGDIFAYLCTIVALVILIAASVPPRAAQR